MEAKTSSIEVFIKVRINLFNINIFIESDNKILGVNAIRDVSVFYLFRHLASTKADLARLGGELGTTLK